MGKKIDKLLSEELYYSCESDRKYMSPSLYKQFVRCEHRAMLMRTAAVCGGGPPV